MVTSVVNVGFSQTHLVSCFFAGVPTKHATYQIVLPIIYVWVCVSMCIVLKGKFRVRVGMEIKKASNHMKKRLVAQSDK